MIDILATVQGPGKTTRWVKAHLDHADKTNCLIWPFGHTDTGYAMFGKPARKVHRVMCEYRHGPAPTPDHHAAHSCDRGHEACVNPNHVDWKTPSENQFDRRRNGIRPRWKLTPDQVREISELKGMERTKDTASRYGVRESNVRLIQSGKAWNRASSFTQKIFTEDEVRLIRSASKSAKQLADELGSSMSAISRIRNRKSYKWVP